MMQVRSKRDCVVDGLGRIKAGEWTDVTEKQETRFLQIHGYPVSEIRSTVVEAREKPKPKPKKEDS